MQAKHISDETAADDNGISASAQSVANNAALTIGGALHSGGTVTLTGGRIVVITSGSDDSAIDFTVVGTDVNGDALSETIDGADGAASTTAHFKTITGITAVGDPAGNSDSRYHDRCGRCDFKGNLQTAQHGHSVRRYSWSSKLPQWHHRRCTRRHIVQTQNSRH